MFYYPVTSVPIDWIIDNFIIVDDGVPFKRFWEFTVILFGG